MYDATGNWKYLCSFRLFQKFEYPITPRNWSPLYEVTFFPRKICTFFPIIKDVIQAQPFSTYPLVLVEDDTEWNTEDKDKGLNFFIVQFSFFFFPISFVPPTNFKNGNNHQISPFLNSVPAWVNTWFSLVKVHSTKAPDYIG